jgi:hypothetical protein
LCEDLGMLQRAADALAAAFCVCFVILGSLWISEVGLQNDEVLFSAGIYPPLGEAVSIFKKPFPMMIMTYVGTLKSLVYTPIFRIWEPSAVSVRFPAVLIGALTVWLFYRLVKQTMGRREAILGAALLTTDTTFLLTTRWDWGPVALQHFCLVAGILSGVRFHETRKLRWLFAGCFVFGLAAWDKALFLWMLAGLGAALLAVFPRQVWQALRWRPVAVAAVAFLLGAFPLIRYNLRNNWVTFSQNAAWSTNELPMKRAVLRSTLDGSALFGTIVRENWEEPARPPDDAAKATLLNIVSWLGEPRKNWQPALFVFAILLAPFVWRSRARAAFLFALIFSAVAWLQMALTKEAGGSAHHAVLLWPIPHLGVAAVLAEVSRRLGRFGAVAIGTLVAVVCLSNVAVVGTYYAYMLRNGPVIAWTDAIRPAIDALPSMRPSFVCVLDWGFFEQIRLLHKGTIPPCSLEDPRQSPVEFQKAIEIPDMLFMTHVTGLEFDAGANERFFAAAKSYGYSPASRRVFYDFNGRPIIEVFKLFRSQLP